MNKTREQKIAFIKDRHLIVNANAGSGKTSVLVGKYLDLVLDKSNPLFPKEIVAITFTEAAANEMRVRLTREIDKLLLKTNSETETLNLNKIKREIFSSKICTIHSFCNGIIRNYPIEAEFSPNSKLIDAYNKNKLLNESKEIVLESIFENYLSSNLNFENDYDCFENSKNDLQYLFIKGSNFHINKVTEELVKRNNESLEKLREELYNLYIGKVELDISSIINKFIRYAEILLDNEFIDFGNSKDNQKFAVITDYLNSFLQSIYLSTDVKFQFDLLKGFVEFIKSLKFGSSYIHTKISKLSILTIGNEILDLWSEINGLIKCDFDLNIFKLHFKYSLAIVDFVIELRKTYNVSKNEMELFEFDEMIEKAFNVFNDKETLRIIKSEIKYLLVDEFQDTDPKQYEMLCMLIPNLKESNLNMDTKLFVVGDEKQGIYGFRNADIKIFNQIKQDIKNTNISFSKSEEFYFEDEPIYLSDKESVGEILLSESFRLKPALAGFINYVCKPLFENSKNEYSVNYDEIICGREKDVFIELAKNKSSTEFKNYIGSITLLNTVIYKNNPKLNDSIESSNEKAFFTDEVDSSQAENNNKPELNEVTNLIKYIVSSDDYLIPDSNGNQVKPSFRDIAVLYRGETDIKSFSKAFYKAGVPYSINRSIVAANLQEIIDLISYMKVLINPIDDISLVSLLKSPFFDFSYIEILDMSIIEGKNYFEKMSNSDYLKNELGVKIKSTLNTLKETILLSKRLPIYLLISRMIEKSNYYFIIRDFPNAELIKSNLEYTIEHAIEFEKRGFTNLENYVDELNSVKDDELESTLIKKQLANDNNNCVTISSIHGSKGLEYPIVILYKASTNLNGMQDYGVYSCGSNQKLFDDLIDDNHLNIIKEIISNSKENKECEEYKRLLYVALTRAKEHILISTTNKANSKGELVSQNNNFSFDSMINNTLNIDYANIENNNECKIQTTIKTSSNDKGIEFEIPIKIINNNMLSEMLDSIESKNDKLGAVKNEPDMNNRLVLLESYNEIQTNQFFSATKLMMYRKDILEYKDRYFYGLPNLEYYKVSNTNQSISDIDIKDEISGAEFGTIIHNVLEKIKFWYDLNAEINYVILIDLIKSQLLEQNEILSEKNINQVKVQIEKIAHSEFIKENVIYILKGEAELQLDMPIGDNFITGSIDLLLQNKEGDFEIWDWKTNLVFNQETLNELKLKYQDQLMLYCYMVSLLYPKQNKFKAKLFFTRLIDSSELNWIQNFEWNREELCLYFNLVSDTVAEINSKNL